MGWDGMSVRMSVRGEREGGCGGLGRKHSLSSKFNGKGGEGEGGRGEGGGVVWGGEWGWGGGEKRGGRGGR